MVQSWCGLVVIENGSYKFNVSLVAYSIQAGGLMLLPRGGMSAWLKSQNNLPQLVQIWNLLDNFSKDPCIGTSTEQAATNHGCSKGPPLDTLASQQGY